MKLLLALFLGGASLGFSTSYTASVTGNWDVAATWGGAGVPVSGDTATINNGITVTIPTAYTAIVGTTPADDDAATPAIQCASSSGTGVLVVNGTLQFRGSVLQCNANWRVNGGGALRHDSSQAGTPSAVHYFWQIGTASSQANAILVFAGSAGNLATVDNAASSGRFGGFTQGSTRANRTTSNAAPSGQLTGAGRIQCSYGSFSHLGVTGFSWSTVHLGVAGYSYTFDNCAVTDSTSIMFTTSIAASANVSFTNSRISSAVDSISISLYDQSGTATGTRLINSSMIAGGVYLSFGLNWVLSNSVFTGAALLAPLNMSGPVAATISNTLSWNRSTNNSMQALFLGSLTHSSLIQSNPAACDSYLSSGSTPTTNLTIDGLVIEAYCPGSSGGGAIIPNWGDVATPMEFTVKNILMLSPTGEPLVFFVDEGVSVASNIHYHIVHNTFIHRGSNGMLDFEAPGRIGGVGRIAELSSNINYRITSGSCLIGGPLVNTPVDGTITTADYNNSYNCTGNQYAGYTAAKYTNTPGVHDLAVDPRFVDSSRTVLTWAASIDPTVTTLAAVQAKFELFGSASWDARWHWDNYYAYERAGFAPRNTALRGAAADGGDIGAVPVVPLFPLPSPISGR